MRVVEDKLATSVVVPPDPSTWRECSRTPEQLTECRERLLGPIALIDGLAEPIDARHEESDLVDTAGGPPPSA